MLTQVLHGGNANIWLGFSSKTTNGTLNPEKVFQARKFQYDCYHNPYLRWFRNLPLDTAGSLFPLSQLLMIEHWARYRVQAYGETRRNFG